MSNILIIGLCFAFCILFCLIDLIYFFKRASKANTIKNIYIGLDQEMNKHIDGKECPCHPGIVTHPNGEQIIDHRKIEKKPYICNFDIIGNTKTPDETGDRYVDIRELEAMSSLAKDDEKEE